MSPTPLILALLVLLIELWSTLAYNPGTSWRNLGAFAALKTSGGVITWGSSNYGGDSCVNSGDPYDPDYTCITDVSSSLSSGVSVIYSAEYAFAALKTDGSVSL